MADTGTTSAGMQEHARTWTGFKAMMTWGTVAAVLIAAGVVLLIAN